MVEEGAALPLPQRSGDGRELVVCPHDSEHADSPRVIRIKCVERRRPASAAAAAAAESQSSKTRVRKKRPPSTPDERAQRAKCERERCKRLGNAFEVLRLKLAHGPTRRAELLDEALDEIEELRYRVRLLDDNVGTVCE